jgi:hypothetical protein
MAWRVGYGDFEEAEAALGAVDLVVDGSLVDTELVAGPRGLGALFGRDFDDVVERLLLGLGRRLRKRCHS